MSIDDFLRKIASDLSLRKEVLNADDFYYMLKYIGIKKNTALVSDIEVYYQELINSLNNSLIKYTTKKQKFGENATYHIGFNVEEKANHLEALKVYFPVKYEYMISSLKTVFAYIIRNNIKATVKFHVKHTNENIVIRFYDKKNVLAFINYCNNNFMLDELLEPLNPFIPNKYGIGMVSDDNTVNTYIGTLSVLLQEYFILLKNTNAYDLASGKDFLDYITKRLGIEEDKAMRFNIESVLSGVNLIVNGSK